MKPKITNDDLPDMVFYPVTHFLSCLLGDQVVGAQIEFRVTTTGQLPQLQQVRLAMTPRQAQMLSDQLRDKVASVADHWGLDQPLN